MQFEFSPESMALIEAAARARGMTNAQFMTWALVQAVNAPIEKPSPIVNEPRPHFDSAPDLLAHLSNRFHGKA